jgi:CD2 antigen cytoplasmic tail-binding protein 2
MFTRTHHLSGDEPSVKKPRFDPRNPSTLAPDAEEEEEDPIRDAGQIGKSSGIKRNAVNIDGYDSDSSEENFDARAEAKSKSKGEDEDEDMFAEEADEEEADQEAEDTPKEEFKKKPVRFMDDDEIEGQEDSSKAGGHVAVDFGAGAGTGTKDVDSSSESGGEEERDRIDSDMDEELGAGGKKKHAPKLDAFNMKAEQEEGRFDEAGNYVRKAYDPDAAEDAWLEGLSKKDIKRAREAHEKKEAERKELERVEESITLSDVLSAMIAHLDVGETPLDALVRHGKAVPERKPKTYNRNRKSEPMEVERDPEKEAAAANAKQAIDAITESATRLTDRGVEDVYHVPREMMMRHYKRETGKEWKDPNPPKWEFRWLTAREEDINGPYDKATMRAWQSSGQFEAGAEFRRVGETEWSRVLDFDD